MNKLYSVINPLRLAAFVVVVVAATASSFTHAFPVESYAPTSKLAQGKWVKIKVPSTGMYKVTASDLRKYGFSNPQGVRVMGYGGTRISDVLTRDSYVDDLVAAPQEAVSDGIVFYGRGPETYTVSSVPGSR